MKKIFIVVLVIAFLFYLKLIYQHHVAADLGYFFTHSESIETSPKDAGKSFTRLWNEHSKDLELFDFEVGNQSITFRVYDHTLNKNAASIPSKQTMKKWLNPLTEYTCKNDALRKLLGAKVLDAVFFQFVDSDHNIHYGHIMVRENHCLMR